MTFQIPNRDQAHAGLRAMKSVLTAAAPLAPVRRTALEAVKRLLFQTDAPDFALDALAPITPAELAAAVTGQALRTQLVSAMATLTLTEADVAPEEVAAVESFASALDVAPATLAQLKKLRDERWLLLRIDVARRALGGAALRQLYEDQGLLAVIKNLGAFAGLWENSDIAARYRALEGYPEGSLGLALYRFYREAGFAFPGEKHGGPEALLPHDLSHILGGYGTDLAGEARVLGFQAGYRKEDPWSVIVFMLLSSQHGLRMTPLAEPQANFFDDKPELVADVVKAFARGTRMNIDLTDRWDFAAVLAEPVESLRRRYGIEPG